MNILNICMKIAFFCIIFAIITESKDPFYSSLLPYCIQPAGMSVMAFQHHSTTQCVVLQNNSSKFTEHFIAICIFSTCSSYILDARSHMLSLILPFMSQLQKYRMISFEHVVTMLLKRLMNHLHISLEGNKLSRLAN